MIIQRIFYTAFVVVCSLTLNSTASAGTFERVSAAMFLGQVPAAATIVSDRPDTVQIASRPINQLPPIVLDPSSRSNSAEQFPRYSNWQNYVSESWTWQLFPDGLLWTPLLASAKESRLGCEWNNDSELGGIWDIKLGGRAAILRYGNRSAVSPCGLQLDIEGAGETRLALDHDRDVEATDYRFGIPLTYGNQVWQFKLAYYHVSSHLGDEYMIRHFPGDYERINYYRDSAVLGISFRPHPNLRLYAEVDYAFYRGELTSPYHFQFGIEFAPPYSPHRLLGAPFFAINGRLMEEEDFGGNICVQAGWEFRGKRNQAFRIGIQYYYGADEQYEFYRNTANKVGFGIWYDF
ncbi:MAG: DUF1207 domain-containing protein [Planctomycetaceae bacterium]|nr:DUF1207 domain-containing protein [Planctomycetaceae bacterium]